MLLTTDTYDSIYVRFSGILMFALGLVATQRIPHNSEIHYLSMVLVRAVI